MNRRLVRRRISTLALAFLLSGPAVAAADDLLDRRITLDLKDADLRMVLGLYEEILEVGVKIDPSIGREISITFEDITVRTSLNAICESARCRWELIDGNPATLRFDLDNGELDEPATPPAEAVAHDKRYLLESPVSLELVEADAPVVLDVAAKLIGAKLLLDRNLQGETITVNASGVPLSTILDSTCADLGCRWTLRDGEPPILEVYYP
jgi:hypothetical protein